MSTADEKFAVVCGIVPAAMKQHRVPGVAIGIFCDGHEFTAGFGVTNVRHPLQVNEHTFFQIGSTTKTFTATLVMRLVEEGKLDLDKPIRNYIPGFRMKDADVTQRVTMRHLLTHTGGWEGDYFDDTARVTMHCESTSSGWRNCGSSPHWVQFGHTTMRPSRWLASWSKR
jgi:CubicO group peptidase (beta-lactamase class C family)